MRWPLTREASAGAGWKPSCGPQGSSGGGGRRHHLYPAVDAVDGASTPSVQRELGEPRRQERIGGWSIQRLCSWAVLIAEVDGKRLKRRALVEGRRPGFGEAVVFDEAAVAAGPGDRQRERGSNAELERGGRDRGRQRPSCTLGARPKKPPPGSTVWRSSIKLRRDQAVLDRKRVAAELKLEVRRQAKLHPSRRESGRSGVGRHAGCSCRELVAEVGETHLSRRHGEARGNSRGSGRGRDSSKRPTGYGGGEPHTPGPAGLMTRREGLAASDRVRGEGRASEQRTRPSLPGL